MKMQEARGLSPLAPQFSQVRSRFPGLSDSLEDRLLDGPLPAGSSAFGEAEVIEDPLSVIRFPGLAGLAGGVVLVKADKQIGQLTADGPGAQQRRQFGQVDQPVGIPAGPVVVGAVDNPEHAMVGLASLVQQAADLFGGGCHLLPLCRRPRLVAARSTAWHAQGRRRRSSGSGGPGWWRQL